MNIVCNSCKQYESNDPVQNETARIVSGAIKLASFNSNLTEMGWETLGSRIIHKLTIPDKKRNAPVRTVQRRGISQVICQFSLYQCKGMSGTAALQVFCNQGSKLC